MQIMQEGQERKFSDLKQAPRNPRRISKHDFDALKTSILRFGDLSGIVRNVRTDHLVGRADRRRVRTRV